MTEETNGKSRKKPRARVTGIEQGIAVATAAVLGQLYRWHPPSRRQKEMTSPPGPFDVRGTFDALNRESP